MVILGTCEKFISFWKLSYSKQGQNEQIKRGEQTVSTRTTCHGQNKTLEKQQGRSDRTMDQLTECQITSMPTPSHHVVTRPTNFFTLSP